MEHGIKVFPFRDPRDQSSGITQWRNCAFCEEEGMHFSDACPRVRDGDTRYNMILRRGWCTHCLEGSRDTERGNAGIVVETCVWTMTNSTIDRFVMCPTGAVEAYDWSRNLERCMTMTMTVTPECRQRRREA
ncbi:hypothetical protein COOONC_07431 [Cooperia oncophora]